MSKQQHSYNSGRIRRANSKTEQPAQGHSDMPERYAPARARKKKRKWPIVLVVVLFILGIAGAISVGILSYLGGVFETGAIGKIINKNYVPKEYSKKDVVHFLIVGIDYEEGRSYAEGLGLTDMILYAKFDLKNSQLNMLQIPRDSYVGTDLPTGNTGKVNALLMSGQDKTNPINNLSDVIEQQYKLPVDHYVSMDMDALKAIVDTFNGLRVYVPQEMDNAGSHLDAGWQWLNGDAVEFFVRNRKGVGFEQADLSRLDNQRHFYSALFRRFLNLTPGDIVKLLPVFEHYCNTDIPLTDIFDICVSALKLDAEHVMFCKVPGATGLDPMGNGLSTYVVDVYGRDDGPNIGTAALLNRYFREEGQEVSADELGLPKVDIPASMTLYEPNVQVMSNVQEGEGGADVDVEPKAE